MGLSKPGLGILGNFLTDGLVEGAKLGLEGLAIVQAHIHRITDATTGLVNKLTAPEGGAHLGKLEHKLLLLVVANVNGLAAHLILA